VEDEELRTLEILMVAVELPNVASPLFSDKITERVRAAPLLAFVTSINVPKEVVSATVALVMVNVINPLVLVKVIPGLNCFRWSQFRNLRSWGSVLLLQQVTLGEGGWIKNQ